MDIASSKDYTSRRQFDEKPNIILGCPECAPRATAVSLWLLLLLPRSSSPPTWFGGLHVMQPRQAI